jgi:hypothetical protein
VGFSDDHMYTFCVARTPRSRDRVDLDNENGSLDEMTLETNEIDPIAAWYEWAEYARNCARD